jgi:hypothetical protein
MSNSLRADGGTVLYSVMAGLDPAIHLLPKTRL